MWLCGLSVGLREREPDDELTTDALSGLDVDGPCHPLDEILDEVEDQPGAPNRLKLGTDDSVEAGEELADLRLGDAHALTGMTPRAKVLDAVFGVPFGTLTEK